MLTLFRNRITVIWALLVLATLVSFDSSRLGVGGENQTLAAAVIMIIAFAKVRFIGLDFMELRNSPLLLRLVFEVWVIAVCLAILAFYYLGLS